MSNVLHPNKDLIPFEPHEVSYNLETAIDENGLEYFVLASREIKVQDPETREETVIHLTY